MAQYTGNTGSVKINDVDYEVLSWTLEESINAIETTPISKPGKTAVTRMSNGLRDSTGSLTFDVTDTKRPIRTTIGAPVAFEFEDEHEKYSGNLLVTSSSTPRQVGEKVTCSVDIAVDGEVDIEPVSS